MIEPWIAGYAYLVDVRKRDGTQCLLDFLHAEYPATALIHFPSFNPPSNLIMPFYDLGNGQLRLRMA